MTAKKPPAPEVIAGIYGSKICRDPNLTLDHRSVGMFLRSAAYKDYCVIQDDEIVMATGLSLERIDNILDDLQSLGYLKRDGFATRGGNPKVRLTVPWVPPATQAKIDAFIGRQKDASDS